MTQRGDDIVWEHDKRGTQYRIIGFATDHNGLPVVVYVPRDSSQQNIHTRLCKEFFDGRYTQVKAKTKQRDPKKLNFGPAVATNPDIVEEQVREHAEKANDRDRVARRDSVAVMPPGMSSPSIGVNPDS